MTEQKWGKIDLIKNGEIYSTQMSEQKWGEKLSE